MIDTPGHVDFNYEVQRSLAACEGAILVVDAAQVLRQDSCQFYLALEHALNSSGDNKIDLPVRGPNMSKEIEDVSVWLHQMRLKFQRKPCKHQTGS